MLGLHEVGCGRVDLRMVVVDTDSSDSRTKGEMAVTCWGFGWLLTLLEKSLAPTATGSKLCDCLRK